MFFIVNKTKKTIVLSDLNITLGPRQAIDLDKALVPRSKSDYSPSLSMAKKNGQIEVRSNDREQISHSSQQPQSDSKNELDSLKAQLKEVKDLLIKQSPSPKNGVSKEDLSSFAKEIIDSIPKPGTVIIQGGGQASEPRSDEDVEMDGDILSEISARTIDKIASGSDVNSMKCKEETQENTILNNIDELEGML